MRINYRHIYPSLMITAFMGVSAPFACAVDITQNTAGPINGTVACGTADLIRTFNVTDNFTLADVDLSLQINHTWRGDLDIRLQSPAGTSAQLTITDTGVGGDINNYNIILDDDAADLINTGPHSTNDGTVAPPFENRVRPANPLSVFNGEPSIGTWTLRICDDFPTVDDGVFNIGVLSLTAATGTADLSAVKSVSVIDPSSLGLYMTPGNQVLYTITVTNGAAATAQAEDIDISDVLPDNVTFISATTTGFTGGSFTSPSLPATNTDCAGGSCVIRFNGGALAENTSGEILVTALIK